jgi:hypothetical protein
MESSPLMLKNCFGLLLRLAGQNRVPEPPAIMTTYILSSSLLTWQNYS